MRKSAEAISSCSRNSVDRLGIVRQRSSHLLWFHWLSEAPRLVSAPLILLLAFGHLLTVGNSRSHRNFSRANVRDWEQAQVYKIPVSCICGRRSRSVPSRRWLTLEMDICFSDCPRHCHQGKTSQCVSWTSLYSGAYRLRMVPVKASKAPWVIQLYKSGSYIRSSPASIMISHFNRDSLQRYRAWFVYLEAFSLF